MSSTVTRVVVSDRASELGVVHPRSERCFARREPHHRVRAYLARALSRIERNNGWRLAEQAGEPLWVLTDPGGLEERVDSTAVSVVPADWTFLSVGDGAKGSRLYERGCFATRPLQELGREYRLLIRRRLVDSQDAVTYVCFAQAGPPLKELLRAAWMPWTIESFIEKAKGQVRLDQYEVSEWVGWYRRVTLALFAHVMLTEIARVVGGGSSVATLLL